MSEANEKDKLIILNDSEQNREKIKGSYKNIAIPTKVVRNFKVLMKIIVKNGRRQSCPFLRIFISVVPNFQAPSRIEAKTHSQFSPLLFLTKTVP